MSELQSNIIAMISAVYTVYVDTDYICKRIFPYFVLEEHFVYNDRKSNCFLLETKTVEQFLLSTYVMYMYYA